MIAGHIHTLSGLPLIVAKSRAYFELLKFRLSFLVAFSCSFGFVLGSSRIDWPVLIMLFIGGFLLSGASVIVNQILEKDLDKLMTRTMSRPLPTARLTVQEAIVFCIICFGTGVSILWAYTNVLTTLLSVLSMI